MKVKLTKIAEEVSDSKYQSDIPVGFLIEGNAPQMPEKGNRFEVQKKKMYLGKDEIMPIFSTSQVTKELDKDGVFKTKSGTYKLEIIQS